MPTHTVAYGDSLTPLGAQLKRKNTSHVLSVVDLTNKTVKAHVISTRGVETVAETASGVTVTDATNGKVQYDMPAGVDAIAAGHYHVYFKVYTGTEWDTYPSPEKDHQLKLDIVALTY